MKRLILVTVIAIAAAACGGTDGDDGSAFVAEQTADDCLLRLHGKGGDGATPRVEGDLAVIQPRGNDQAWNGHQWDYRTDDGYADARAIVLNVLNQTQCQRVVIHGFSNGAAMTAALYCDPSFHGGPVVGYIVDDPVTDDVPVGCTPDPAAEVVLYWTDALPRLAAPGTACDSVDWTCLGDTVRTIDDYAADLGVEPTPRSAA